MGAEYNRSALAKMPDRENPAARRSVDMDVADGNGSPLPLNAAAREWARLTGTKRPHRATILRWCTKGCRGIRLAGERAGNVWWVTPAALREFHRRLNERSCEAAPSTAGPVRVAEIARALQELDAIIGTQEPAA
jgi:hypothetical protein